MTECPWPVDTNCLPDDWADFDVAVREYAVLLASGALRVLSAGRYGACPITVRPCSSYEPCLPAYASLGAAWMSPGINASGFWINSCGCASTCGCDSTCTIDLPAPVGELISVKIDGNEQTLTNFRIDDGHLLVYTAAGECPFPARQNLRLNDTEPDTFSITYLNAFPIDSTASVAMSQLAYDLALACKGDKESLRKCRLPANVKAIVRTGVTMELAQGIWPDGFVGIQAVDAWIATVNPQKRKSQTRVYSPDVAQPRVQGWLPTQEVYDGGSP